MIKRAADALEAHAQAPLGTQVLAKAAVSFRKWPTRWKSRSLPPASAKPSSSPMSAGTGQGEANASRGSDLAASRREHRPQHIRNSAAVRETVAYLLNQAVATAGGRELRGVAARVGVPN